MRRSKGYFDWLLHGDDDSSVAAPAAGAAALGGTYGGLRFLNNSLARHGWAEANGFNNGTLDALNAYLKLKPGGENFGLDYVDRTYKALSSPLFKNKPDKVYEVLLNGSDETNAIKGLAEDTKKSLLGRIFSKLSGGRFGKAMDAAGDSVSSITSGAIAKGRADAEMTHMPAMGRSFQDAYLRGLQETTGAATSVRDGMGLPMRVGERANILAEALFGTKPKGMTELDYLNKMLKNDAHIGIAGQPGKYRALKNAYSDALEYARKLTTGSKSVEEAAAKLVAAMGGNSNANISSVVGELVGKAPKWSLADGAVKVTQELKPGRLQINSVQDAINAAKESLALKLMHGDMSRTFSTASGHHISQIRGPQVLGMLRNKLLRRGTGVAALGLGGLATYNLAKNIKNRNTSFWDRLTKGR